jgi:uncharacterized membrane protein YgaE (UPF0421/DUF939 family)
MIHSTHTAAFQLSLRAAVAAGLAVAVAQWFRFQYPIYAMISAVIVTDLEASRTLKLGLPRLAGTVLGASLGAVICTWLKPGGWEISLGIFVAMFLSNLLHLHGAARVAGYVCGIVLFTYGDHPWSYAFHRTLETFLGIGLATLVSLSPKLLPTDPPGRHDPGIESRPRSP